MVGKEKDLRGFRRKGERAELLFFVNKEALGRLTSGYMRVTGSD